MHNLCISGIVIHRLSTSKGHLCELSTRKVKLSTGYTQVVHNHFIPHILKILKLCTGYPQEKESYPQVIHKKQGSYPQVIHKQILK